MNSAVITLDTHASAPCIYLHYNGDAASVRGFLLAAGELGLGLPDDMTYAAASAWLMDEIAEMIARRFFGCEVGQVVYRCQYSDAACDNGHHGVYLIDQNLLIVGRRYQPEPDTYNDAQTLGVAQAILNYSPDALVFLELIYD